MAIREILKMHKTFKSCLRDRTNSLSNIHIKIEATSSLELSHIFTCIQCQGWVQQRECQSQIHSNLGVKSEENFITILDVIYQY